ncbi:MAG TPA: hypothetical protein VM450_19465 [Thermomicrobiales bacterium]|nr:hypothetical protein [Thermomicrobiales bacterium]
MFDPKSRYAKQTPYQVTDRRGRTVNVVPVPEPPGDAVLGYHVLRQGQRLDHLAANYLDDPAGFWRICHLNDAMLPEALSEAREIAIPRT